MIQSGRKGQLSLSGGNIDIDTTHEETLLIKFDVRY